MKFKRKLVGACMRLFPKNPQMAIWDKMKCCVLFGYLLMGTQDKQTKVFSLCEPEAVNSLSLNRSDNLESNVFGIFRLVAATKTGTVGNRAVSILLECFLLCQSFDNYFL